MLNVSNTKFFNMTPSFANGLHCFWSSCYFEKWSGKSKK